MIMNNTAIDSNVIIYALDEKENSKNNTALEILINNRPILSSQAFSEVINVCYKKLKYDKQKLIKVADFLLKNTVFFSVAPSVIVLAHTLIEKYNFQYFDSLIVASALKSGCTTLYSEDMQSGLYINDVLTIVNPFLYR